MSDAGTEIIRVINEATITLRKDGIIQIHYHEGVEINPPLQDRVMKIFIELSGGIKRPFLFTAMEYVTVTKEARSHAIEMESVYPALASAVVAHSTAYRIIANFYLKVNKPKTPYKVFSTEAKAVEWLFTFIENK
jgi:hypothetical protein